jgi:hypothetical protein
MMAIPTILPCDGCGQLASAEHFSRRLRRLEWATRFRPIHVQALLLAAAAPESDDEFLYHPQTTFAGMPGQILEALSLTANAKLVEEVLIEIQKRGLVFAQALECPVDAVPDDGATHELLCRHLSSAIARIRRSLKPRRVLVLSPELQPFLGQLSESALGCPVFYTPFSARQVAQAQEIRAFRAALPSLLAQGA